MKRLLSKNVLVQIFLLLLSQNLLDQKIEITIKYWSAIADCFEEEWGDIEKLEDLDTRGRKDFDFKLLELKNVQIHPISPWLSLKP